MFSIRHPAVAGALVAIVIGTGLFADAVPAMAALDPAFGTGFDAVAPTAQSSQMPSQQPSKLGAREPFESETLAISRGGMVDKWRATASGLGNDERILARCRTEPANCPVAASRFLAVVDQVSTKTGYDRIAAINQTINQVILPVEDIIQYGVPEFWATPLVTFASNAGDCEDYAIAKYLALRTLGVEEANLRLVVVRDHVNNEGHAVAAVRHQGRWLILDNRTLGTREDAAFSHFEPLFILDRHGTHRVAKQMPRFERLPIADGFKALRPLQTLSAAALARRAGNPGADVTARRGFISQLFLLDGFGQSGSWNLFRG